VTPRLAAVPLTEQDPARPLLVVGPSLGTSAEGLWSACARELAASFSVVGWDLPGHGGSPATAEPFSVAGLAAAVLELAEELLGGRGEPAASFAYAGDSFGGAVGLQLLLDAPGRITSAVLVATGARIATPESWRERAALVRDRGTSALLAAAPARWFAPGFPERDPAVATRLLGDLEEADDRSYALACEALAGFDVRSRLQDVEAPVLAVAGRHDGVTPVADLAAIAGTVRRGRLAVLGDCGHLPPAEAPSQLADLVAAVIAPVNAPVRDRGAAVRRAVLGDAHVDRAAAATTGFTRDFQDLITRYAWGEIWGRPGLDRRSRSLITLTALVALGHHEELALHVRGARRNGLTQDEIGEALLQTAIYCGVPAANTAFRVAQRVLDEMHEEEHEGQHEEGRP
jgi:3-oxoadipate enol-lactonase/4-carboxymuconolactone decarboxylase